MGKTVCNKRENVTQGSIVEEMPGRIPDKSLELNQYATNRYENYTNLETQTSTQTSTPTPPPGNEMIPYSKVKIL